MSCSRFVIYLYFQFDFQLKFSLFDFLFCVDYWLDCGDPLLNLNLHFGESGNCHGLSRFFLPWKVFWLVFWKSTIICIRHFQRLFWEAPGWIAVSCCSFRSRNFSFSAENPGWPTFFPRNICELVLFSKMFCLSLQSRFSRTLSAVLRPSRIHSKARSKESLREGRIFPYHTFDTFQMNCFDLFYYSNNLACIFFQSFQRDYWLNCDSLLLMWVLISCRIGFK